MDPHEEVLSAAEASAFIAFNNQPQMRSATFAPTDMADDGSWFEGYAAVFGEEAEYEVNGIGMVSEEVKHGAFKRVLAEQKDSIPMLYHHLETHPPLATTSGGTLILEERAKGLWTRANVAKHYMGEAVRELVRRGDIPGMSWGFFSDPKMSRIERRSGRLHRSIMDFKKILDVAPTWDVTYRGTTAEFRAKTIGMALPSDVMEQFVSGEPVSSEDEQAITPQDGEAESRSESQAGKVYVPSLEQRKRRLSLYILEHGGTDGHP
jgi:HK97 family phage prohead protease